MGKQKTLKRLRRIAEKMGEQKNATSALPEAYPVNGRRTLNIGRGKGTYKWLRKNHQT